jgi:transposase InsO family protein
MEWFEFNDKNYIVIEDDASRFIIHFGEYERATAENSINALRKGIDKYGKPREVMIDHGTQFTSLPRNRKESGPNEFQRYLEDNGIIHIKARVKHPQSNGKLERLIFTLKDLRKYFNICDEVVDYYNKRRMHMNLYEDKIITPTMAYEIKN